MIGAEPGQDWFGAPAMVGSVPSPSNLHRNKQIFYLVPSGYIWLFLSRFEGECAEPIMAGAPNQSWPGSAPVIVQLSLIFTHLQNIHRWLWRGWGRLDWVLRRLSLLNWLGREKQGEQVERGAAGATIAWLLLKHWSLHPFWRPH